MNPNQNHRRPQGPQPPPPPPRSPLPPDSAMRQPNQAPRPQQSPSPSPSPRPANSTTPRSDDPPRHPPPPAPPRQPPIPDPLPEPTFAAYPPYMIPPPRRRSGSGCASCMLATAFILIVAAIAVAACFVLFKPQDPKIAVNSVRFPAFSLSNNTIDFTIFQYVAVRNPNRYSFSHYDSSLQLFYYGSQLGFMFIPAGQIAPGRTQYVSATFNVKSIPVVAAAQPATTAAVSAGGAVVGPGPTMEVETRMKIAGRVRVLKVLAHHVETRVRCRVTIEVSNGNVLGFHC